MAMFGKALGSLVFCAVMAGGAAMAQSAAGTNAMPDHSIPTERAETAALNRNISQNNAAIDAQARHNAALYQQQKAQYEDQLHQSQAAEQAYEAKKAQYDSQAAQYAAARAAYQQAVSPDR